MSVRSITAYARFLTVAAMLLFATTLTSRAQSWEVSTFESVLSYGSIKKGVLGEVNRFIGLEGKVLDSGEFIVRIPLATIQTGVDIRNARMVEHVFKDETQVAELLGRLDVQTLTQLPVGGIAETEVVGTLKFLGKSIDVLPRLRVIRLSEDRVSVSTADMIFIRTAELGIDPALDVLARIAKLDSISRIVPVTFSLIFNRSGADVSDQGLVQATQLAADSPVSRGRLAIRVCGNCHAVDVPVNSVAPHLVKVFDRKAGTLDDYEFSPALRKTNFKWNENNLRRYIMNPQEMVPGTRMITRLSDVDQVNDIIAYLRSK